jgi:hypothetical protein
MKTATVESHTQTTKLSQGAPGGHPRRMALPLVALAVVGLFHAGARAAILYDLNGVKLDGMTGENTFISKGNAASAGLAYTGGSSPSLTWTGGPTTYPQSYVVGYFPSASLANVGDSVTLTYAITPSSTSAFAASDQLFRVGLYQSGGNRISADVAGTGDAAFNNYTGYRCSYSPRGTTGTSNTMYQRTGASANLITAAAHSNVAGGPKLDSPGTGAFTGSLQITREAGGVRITSVTNGGAAQSVLDTSDTTTSFDTVCFFANVGSNNPTFVFSDLSVSIGAPVAATYYVDPDPAKGNDANPGSLTAPFRTIQKARDVVRTINASMSGDIIINLRGGWFVLTSPLTFTAADSGGNGYNVIYQAYAGEFPVISGGRQITGWTVHDAAKGIWKAPAPALETRQLFVNGVRAIRAHSGSGLSGATRTSTGYTISNSPMRLWGNVSDIEFVYNGMQGATGGAKWTERRCGVSSVSGTAIVMKQPCWSRSIADTLTGVTIPSDIENAFELLDQPGEWYLDRAADVIYYKPLAGENMATADVEAPVLENLVSGTAALGTPIHNIQFKGITFAHATWLAPNGNNGFAEMQGNNQLAGLGFPNAAVSFKTAQNIRFERCVFTQLGGMGLELSEGAQNCEVIGCEFTDISGNPVKLGKTTDPTRTDARARDTGIRVENCYIHDAPVEYRGGVGIFAGYVADTRLAHNEIAYTTYSGISMGWIQSNTVPDNSYMANNEIAWNDIHHVLSSLADGGAIYTLGAQTGSSWHDNYIHDMPWAGTNRQALYPDRMSAYIDIHHNVIENIASGRWFYVWGSAALVHDLQIHDNYTNTSSYLNGSGSSTVTMTNNTVVSGGNWPQAAIDIMNGAGLEAAYQDLAGEVIDFNAYAISGYGGQDGAGTVEIQDGGVTLKMTGNTWKKIALPYAVTASTVLEFDFRSATQGEVHGIGIDTDEVLTQDTFQLYGTQTWGRQNYRNYPGGGNWVHYVIPLGQFYTGPMSYLYFANDKDVSPYTNDSYFSNVQVHE